VKNFLKIFIPFAILGILLFKFHTKIFTEFWPRVDYLVRLVLNATPCDRPIPYAVSTFDPQFHVSKEDFLSALSAAEAIWEKPSGLELFSYNSNYSRYDLLKINLIYDYRQQATDKLKSLGISVKDTRASYDALKEKFDALKKEYEKEKNSFNVRVSSFNKRQEAYEEEVNYWNKKGGAPENEYKRLEATRLELAKEANQLKEEESRLNAKADEINALVVVLNRLATTLNLSVEKYNTTNTSRGETFEEGVYVSDGINREIDIYEFSSREKLVRVLAHELGHSLNLEHVQDPNAIMYELNQGESLTLTKTDLEALNQKCGIK